MKGGEVFSFEGGRGEEISKRKKAQDPDPPAKGISLCL